MDDCEKRRRERRESRHADTERLKQLGGRPRSEAEEREFNELFARDPGRSRAYFERRIWEKRSAAPAT